MTNVRVQPLISPPTPLMVIRDEYLNGSQTVVKKLDWLQENGWDQVWRARGDGDCFYRCESSCGLVKDEGLKAVAFTIAYILKILHSPDPSSSSKQSLTSINHAAPSETTNFDPELVSCRNPVPNVRYVIWHG